jgi:hypothetical protein
VRSACNCVRVSRAVRLAECAARRARWPECRARSVAPLLSARVRLSAVRDAVRDSLSTQSRSRAHSSVDTVARHECRTRLRDTCARVLHARRLCRARLRVSKCVARLSVALLLIRMRSQQ